MASLAELARERTSLSEHSISHLQRLVRSWGLLADLSFSDLVLHVPIGGNGFVPRFLVIAHVRPTTGQTLYHDDIVGSIAEPQTSVELSSVLAGHTFEQRDLAGIRGAQLIPVRVGDKTIAVLERERFQGPNRDPSPLERAYAQVFADLAEMVSSGLFPFPDADADEDRAPRIGDGVLLLDAHSRVTFSSPNAVSALHRIGFHKNARGATLGELGVDVELLRTAFERQRSVSLEVRRGRQVTVIFHCIPLIKDGVVTGAMAVLRDVTELRRRDLMIMSKDATIREIHHRVKNNLQTVSSLLHLQVRRVQSDEARFAINDSARRIASIAIVHETLAHGADDTIDFDEVLRPLVRLVQEGISSPDRPMTISVTGLVGVLDPEVATPLAVVVTELLQNAADHAFPAGTTQAPTVVVELRSDRHRLEASIRDNGIGLPAGFSLESEGLGLTIARTFVEVELHGRLTIANRPIGSGTEVRVDIPTPPRVVASRD